MRTLSLFSRFLAAAALVATAALLPAGTAVAADRFVTLDPAQPSDSPGKIEVLEFFAYTCPHCKVLAPLTEQWKKKLPDDVVVRLVPVGFNASMRPLQQFYYALEAVNRLDLHGAVFTAIHDQRVRLFDKNAIVDWVAKQGVDRDKFAAAYDSFGVQSKVQRANQLVQAYRVEGTPSVAVGGRYLTSPSMAQGYQQTLDVAGQLVDRVRANP